MLVRDDVMAVPYKNLVYAWGSKSVIEEACKGKLKTNIELCPLSRATIAGNSTFRELLLKTLVRILAASHGLGHSKDKIWDTKEVLKYRIGAKTVTAYSGVRLALLFDNKYSYLTLVPSFMYADDAVLTREEKKQFADWFNARVNNGRPNQNANEYIRKWVRKVIGNKRFSANYPLGSTTNFTFSVVNSSALIGVNFGKQGLVESLSSAGVKNIELLEITYEDNLKCFALNERCTQVDGYPVRRGMCFPIDKNTMYLFTHGIAPSVISPKRRYFQGGKSVPLPLKVVKHYGSGDMAQIATEILGLSKMNWNSFGLYSKLPCTIESSNEIARIGWLLSQFEGTLYDYRYFM